jgi:hypothetical protein
VATRFGDQDQGVNEYVVARVGRTRQNRVARAATARVVRAPHSRLVIGESACVDQRSDDSGLWHVHCLDSHTTTAHVRVVKRADIMDTRVPELDQSLSAIASSATDEVLAKRDDESRAQEAALERLADRVNAARSIV